MSRHYIEELGIDLKETPQGWNEEDSRQKSWSIERDKYGFDERDTWSLGYTMDLLLYERLCMYKEIASELIDLEYYKFTYKGVELNQLECIDKMLEGLKLDLTLGDWDKKREDEEIKKLIEDVYPIYALCKNALWW